MDKNTKEVMFSSDRQDWETPQDKWEEWNSIYDFQVDLASSKENSKCGDYFIDEEIDSLNVNWHTLTDGWMFLNPPYSQSKEFIKKQIAFREWLEEVDAEVSDIPRGTFKESGTMVGGKIIVIDK